jgi:hypothetical protein
MNQATAIHLTAAALAGGLLAAVGQQAALSGNAVSCSQRGEWPHTADAAWTARVIAASGFNRIGCTGSAFVIDTEGSGRSGHDLYVLGESKQGAPQIRVTPRHDGGCSDLLQPQTRGVARARAERVDRSWPHDAQAASGQPSSQADSG